MGNRGRVEVLSGVPVYRVPLVTGASQIHRRKETMTSSGLGALCHGHMS